MRTSLRQVLHRANKRRRWLALLFVVSAALWSLCIEPARLVRRPLTYRWPHAALRVVFFSDLHRGSPHIDAAYVKTLVTRINNEKADLILIGGDLLINDVVLGEWVDSATIASELAPLHAQLGTFAVLGNHDWWNDAPEVRKQLTEKGIRVLDNESLQLGVGSATFNLVGIGDAHTEHANPLLAFQGINKALPTIAFMHDASALLLDPAVHFDMAFSGHTHGGQVFLPLLGALIVPGRAPSKWAYGDVTLPQGQLRVSSGIGTSIFPIRFNMPPEYLVVELTPQ
jgi:uncharacterized protein